MQCALLYIYIHMYNVLTSIDIHVHVHASRYATGDGILHIIPEDFVAQTEQTYDTLLL